MLVSRRITILALAALILLVMASGSTAAPVGTFTRVQGTVDILRAGQAAVLPALTGDTVSMGDAVRTLRGSRAEIRFQDDTVIQIAPESRIAIDEYSFNAEGARERGFLSLFRGKIRAIVSKVKAAVVPASLRDTGFSIKTPTAIAGVRGTDFIVYYQRGVTGVVFLEGLGFLYNPKQPDKIVTIHGGQASFVTDASAPPTNAQSVAGSFVAPHLKDTTVVLMGSEGGGAAGSTEREGPIVTVAAANMTAEALASMLGAEGRLDYRPQDTGRGLLIQLPVLSLVPENPQVPYRPPTETTPALISTPVTVNVRIP